MRTETEQPFVEDPEDLSALRYHLSLPGLLRMLGGAVVVAAFSVFLFQGWDDGNDVTRYLLLLGHTVLLTLAGFLIGHLLREAQGARLLISLALAAVPVNFAILGGFIYPYFTWESGIASVPSFADWQADSAEAALRLTSISAALLIGAVWLGFLVLARRSAVSLAAWYLLGNGALLVPAREPALAAGMLAVLGLGLSWAMFRRSRQDPTLAAAEGVYARWVQALPLLIMAGRTVWLYAPGALFFTATGFLLYLLLRQLRASAGANWRGPLEWLAVLVALGVGSGLFWVAVDSPWPGDEFALPMAGLAIALLLLDLGRLSSQDAGRYRSLASLSAVGSLVLNLAAFGGLLPAMACLIAGLVTLSAGYGTRNRTAFFTGLLGGLAGLGYAVAEAISGFSLGGWTGLALVGVLAILAGSVMERHGDRLRLALVQWRQRFED